jgi:hypothetical protein
MGQFIINILNSILNSLGALLSFAILALPKSPFAILDNSPIAEFLPTINYFVPVNEMIGIGQAWLTAIAIYYIYVIALRWIKAIE